MRQTQSVIISALKHKQLTAASITITSDNAAQTTDHLHSNYSCPITETWWRVSRLTWVNHVCKSVQSIKRKYRWVLDNPNMDNPNSSLIRKNHEEKFPSLQCETLRLIWSWPKTKDFHLVSSFVFPQRIGSGIWWPQWMIYGMILNRTDQPRKASTILAGNSTQDNERCTALGWNSVLGHHECLAFFSGEIWTELISPEEVTIPSSLQIAPCLAANSTQDPETLCCTGTSPNQNSTFYGLTWCCTGACFGGILSLVAVSTSDQMDDHKWCAGTMAKTFEAFLVWKPNQPLEFTNQCFDQH